MHQARFDEIQHVLGRGTVVHVQSQLPKVLVGSLYLRQLPHETQPSSSSSYLISPENRIRGSVDESYGLKMRFVIPRRVTIRITVLRFLWLLDRNHGHFRPPSSRYVVPVQNIFCPLQRLNLARNIFLYFF